jgi:hypothetical protein
MNTAAPTSFFKHPILNSPYDYPGPHGELDVPRRLSLHAGRDSGHATAESGAAS